MQLTDVKTKNRLVTFKPFTNVFFWTFIMCSIILKCIYYQFITHINTRPFSISQNIYMGISSLAVMVIISSAFFILTSKKMSWAMIVMDIVLTVFLVADTLYTRYYTTAISVPVLFQIKLIGSVGGSILSLFKYRDLFLFFDFPLIVLWMIFFERQFKTRLVFVKRLIISAALIVLSFIIFLLPLGKANLKGTIYDNNEVIKNMGIVYFHFYDGYQYVKNNLFRSKNLTADEKSTIDNYFKANKPTGDKYKGIAKGKNLLIVQVEALQGFVINKKLNGKEITPNLNQLAKDNLYLNNFYYQVEGGNTSDAEFMVNTSLYPVKEGSAYLRYATNTYHSLPQVLKGKGYTTSSFHAYNPSFWNRSVMYQSLGIDRFVSYGDFKIDEFAGWGGYALSDSSFFRQSLEKLDKSKPFYSMFITLSSHHPYDYFDSKSSFDVGEYSKTNLGNYIKGINYVDSAIGELIKSLKDQGLYDNTLLVLYGDHYALPRSQSDELFKLEGVANNEFEFLKLQKVPLIIHIPGVDKGQTISTVCGQIDVLPTIANLMDIDYPYAMGKDILNTDRNFAVIRNFSVVTDKFLYDNTADKLYGINDGQLLDKTNYENEIKNMQNIRNISETIIEKDAFKKGK